MSETPAPLDADEVACPKSTCLADPGIPCRTPSGKKAARIHPERLRLAAAGGIHDHDQANDKRGTGTPRKSPGTKASRSKGGKAAAQARRRRRSEIEARAEQLRVEEERKAAEAEAQRLAEDAIRYSKDRALVKRNLLDVTLRSSEALLEAIRDRKRVVLDEEGRARTTPVEVFDDYGVRVRHPETEEPITREVVDVRGYVSAADLDRLAKVLASSVTTLRLEEGKATGITEERTGGAAALGDEGVAKLIEYAQANLTREGEG